MKAKYYFIILLAGILLWNCKGEEKSGVWDETIEKSTEFPEVKTPATEAHELGAIVSIMEWYVDDSLMVCQSTSTKTCFYRFRMSNWSLVDSLGAQGNGPKEFVFPHLNYKAPGEFLVIDNGNRKACLIEGDSIIECPQIKVDRLFNSTKLLKNGDLGFVDFTPDNISWKACDLESGTITDSLCIANDEGKKNSNENEFAWDTSASHMVLSFFNKDQFAIASRESNGKLSWKLYSTNAPIASKGQCYYAGIICADDCFYVLSQKNVDMKARTGNSEIEVYNYDGKPLQLLKLDFIAKYPLLDSARSRLLLLSPQDDLVHSVSLN